MWYYFIIAGVLSGIIGGMGMGGGTILIPILTIFLGISQHISQGVNLAVFVPLATIAIIIHAKNKLIDYKTFFYVILPAISSSILFSFLSNGISTHLLKFIFAIFLIVLGSVMFFVAIFGRDKKLTKRLGV